MKTASVTEAKNGLSALLNRVKAGETIVITDRGIPVASLEPITWLGNDVEARLQRLERAGVLRRGTGKPPIELLLTPPPATRDGSSIVEAVLEERRSGR